MSRIHAYESRPYLRELEVEIEQVEAVDDGWHAALDDTVLYPEGGGQPADRGWLDGIEVARVVRTPEGLRHVVAEAVSPGSARLVLDWERRYDHMQQHSAQHVITRTALDRFGWATRSFHIGPEVSDIELDCAPPDPDSVLALEDAVAEVIVAARPIRAYRVSPDEYAGLEVRSRGLPSGHTGDIRLVEIEDFDLNTCGGTHLASTAEVEMVKVVGSESLRGGCRLFWVAGRRVRRRLEKHESRLAALRGVLDTGDAEMIEVVRGRLQQLKSAQQAQRRLERQVAAAIARQLVASGQRVLDLHLEENDAVLLRPVAECLGQLGGFEAALLTAAAGPTPLFAIVLGVDDGLDLAAVGGAVAEVLGGRGGGARQVFQGKAGSLDARAAAVARLRDLVG